MADPCVPLAALLPCLERIAPLQLAEAWDNVGLLVGHPAQPICRVLVCNDWGEAGLAQARAAGPLHETLVLAYHPPWFSPLKRLVGDGPQAVLHATVSAGAAIYSMHTALDAARGGTAELLAAAAGLTHAEPVVPKPADAGLGAGRIGRLPQPQPFSTWLRGLKDRTGAAQVLCARPARPASAAAQDTVACIAVAPGAGRSLWQAAKAAGAQVLVTGELPHHDALAATQAGLFVVCLLHSVSERLALGPVAAKVQAAMPMVSVRVVADDVDPYVFA